MKRGFTLVEMLIVVVVLVTLMAIAFRLSSVGDDQLHRNTTIARMQRLENCLSGYYAAFGSYPPVKVHGSRDFIELENNGMQKIDDTPGKFSWDWDDLDKGHEGDDWLLAKAACLAQPVACNFPFHSGYNNYISSISAILKKKAESSDSKYKSFKNRAAVLTKGFEDGFSSNKGNLSGNISQDDWRESQLFRFGLMSFLLPRYVIMLQSDTMFYDNCTTWEMNNSLPCRALTGVRYDSWSKVKSELESDNDRPNVLYIPSQAACQRWMPNLEKICSGDATSELIYGVDISDGGGTLNPDDPYIEIYTSRNGGAQYVLDGVTVHDGWHRDFYYYSPSPHQTYILWSAGPNGRTFPPWVDRTTLDNKEKANRCISIWVSDDIVHMSH